MYDPPQLLITYRLAECFCTALSASLDFGFALYAVVTVMSLNMTRVQKVVIASSMGLGFGYGIFHCPRYSK